ncbi:MAG: aldo/keto reductase [Nitrososphaeria archaeon]
MKERILGRTGLKVRVLGFGGIPIQRISEEEAVKVVRCCYDCGINYFDTARAYTVSEGVIGKALEDVRDQVVIATKTQRLKKMEVLGELETSLKNLRTEWVDIYQLHNVATEEDWKQAKAPGGALEALIEAHDDGRIRHLGITSHNPLLLKEIVQENIFETILVQYNYLTRQPGEELLPFCHRNHVGTVIMKPFGGGAFSNARTALKFLLNDKNVDVIVPGMMSLKEVEENVAIASASHALSSEELEVIEKDRKELGTEYCHGCDYCQPCPQGISISFVLRSTWSLKRMGLTPFFQSGLQKAKQLVPTCLNCGECESRCPYHLPIRELLPVKLESVAKMVEQGNF